MTFQLVLFSFDMLEFSVTLIVLGLLWFADKRTSRVRSLLVVGMATCFWIIFDSVAMVARAEVYGYFYTLRSIMLVIDPYCLLWFVLSMNEFPLLKSKAFNRTLFLIPALDVVLLLTDPFHHLVFTRHGFPLPEYGPFFAVHSGFAYIAVVAAIVYIFRFIIRYRPPVWFSLLAGTFSLMPVVVNVLFTLHLIQMDQDIAPTAFFVLFLLFAINAFHARLVNFKAIALTEIFELFQDPIIFVEKDFIIIDSNKAMNSNFPDFKINSGTTSIGELAEYLKSRCTGKNLDELFDRLDLSRSAATGIPQGHLGELTIPSNTAGGEARTFTINLLKVYRFQKLYGYSITFSDVSSYRAMITEMTGLKEMAESSSRAKSTFLANMSHEIRTPLNAIIGLGELELRKNLAQETRTSLGKIQNSAQILLSIINDLLDISKIESGRFELIPVEYSLPDLISDVVNINFVRIGSKPIRVSLKVNEDVPSRLFGDELRVRQLFSNILSNAFKYTLEGQVELSISCERLLSGESTGGDFDRSTEGDGTTGSREQIVLVYAVKDTGLGIKGENMAKLFTDYYQVDGKSNRLIEGTGLGLAISKRFALMMGGDIQVESEFGRGSVFTVRIGQEVSGGPIGAENARSLQELRFIHGMDAEGRENGEYQGPAFQLPNARILIVDDVEINLEVAKGMLEVYGAVIDCVESGQAAVDLVRDGIKYDIVFMDHMMPGMDGIEAVQIIRNEIGASSEYARQVPIVALTANAILGNEAMFLEHGFQAMLPKPMDIGKMEGILKKYVGEG
ncbi:MAG: response regulator [Treponema sp.]|jgi:signal transduction histidine kinase/CheY-like chemotaxis protein|nr:response regulator [Treponema sp.]